MTFIDPGTPSATTDHASRVRRGMSPLHIVVLLLALATLSMACFLPMYTDEITWKATLGREHWDHLRTITVTMQPSCAAQYAQPTPAVMLPAHWLDTLLYEPLATPLRMRMFGVGFALLWVLVAWQELCAITRGIASRLETMAVLLAWSTLGVMPFMLVLGRPEQALLLGITIFLLRSLRPRPTNASVTNDVVRGVLFNALLLYVLCEHPRALFVLPLAALCLYRSLERPAMRWGFIAAGVVLAGLAQVAWQPLWACDQDPLFAAKMAYANIGTAHRLGMTHAYIASLLRSLVTPSGWYLQQFAPKDSYSGQVLPPFDLPFDLPFARGLRWLVEAEVLLGMLGGLWAAARVLRRWRSNHPGSSRLLAPAAGWLFFLASVLVRVQKNDYEAELMEPLIGLLVFASIWVFFDRGPGAGSSHLITPARLRVAIAVLLGTSVISQSALLAAYGRDAESRWKQPGQPQAQSLSVSVENEPALEKRVLATAKLCRLDPSLPLRHLVVDQTTYFIFRASNEPLFAPYFDPKIWSSYRPDPTQLFRGLDSAGWIASCDRLPTAYARQARHIGNTCCLPAFQ